MLSRQKRISWTTCRFHVLIFLTREEMFRYLLFAWILIFTEDQTDQLRVRRRGHDVGKE